MRGIVIETYIVGSNLFQDFAYSLLEAKMAPEFVKYSRRRSVGLGAILYRVKKANGHVENYIESYLWDLAYQHRKDYEYAPDGSYLHSTAFTEYFYKYCHLVSKKVRDEIEEYALGEDEEE